MISLRIWSALLTPFVAHPLYQRWGVWTPPNLDYNNQTLLRRFRRLMNKYEPYWFNGIIVLIILGAILIDFWTMVAIVLGGPFLLMAFGIPFLLIVGGTVYGLTSGLIIGNAIINEKMQGRYELVGLTNYGFEGVIWALCSLSLQRNHLLKRMREAYKGLFFIMMVLVLIPLVMIGSITVFNPQAISIEIVTSLILGILVVATLAVEFVQSSNVGSLIGMLAPNYAHTRMDTRNIILSGFVVLQLGAYITIGFFNLLVFPQIFEWLDWNLTLEGYQIIYGVLALIMFYLVREIVVIFLWRMLANIINVELAELDRIAHVGIGNDLLPTFFNRRKKN